MADVDRAKLQRVVDEFHAKTASPRDIVFADVDVLAPCALGNVLTSATIPKLRAKVIAGAANNQLATEDDGVRLTEHGILYAPDYVINAGGIINVAHEYLGNGDDDEVRADVEKIPQRLESIFATAEASGKPTNIVANELARRLVNEKRRNYEQEITTAHTAPVSEAGRQA